VTTQTEIADLLEAARDIMARSILPSLSGDARYEALMALNALGIASRTLLSDDKERLNLSSRLFILLGGTDPSDGDPRRTLAMAIRDGRFDRSASNQAKALMSYLRASVEFRLRSENPKLVQATATEFR